MKTNWLFKGKKRVLYNSYRFDKRMKENRDYYRTKRGRYVNPWNGKYTPI